MKLKKISVITLAIMMNGLLSVAQVPNTDTGLMPFGSYHGGAIDSVSLMNGNLNLDASVICYPQRGDKLNLCFSIRYNNKGWRGVAFQQQPNDYVWKWQWVGNGAQIVRDGVMGLQDNSREVNIIPGIQTDPPRTAEIVMLNAIMSDGGSHQLGTLNQTAQSGDSAAIALDATGIRYLPQTCPSAESPLLPALIEANGVRHVLQGRSQFTVPAPCAAPVATPGNWSYQWNGTAIETWDGSYPVRTIDPNGNTITVTPSGWVDTIGRLIPGSAPTGIDYGNTNPYELLMPGVPTSDFSNCPANTVSARVWNLPGPNAGTSTIMLCYSNIVLSTNFHTPSPCAAGGTCFYTEGNLTVPMLRAVVLPDLSYWTFDYNNYGDLAKIKLPAGGSISYTWINHSWPTGDDNTPVSRTISSRTVDANDGTGPHTWTYNWDSPLRLKLLHP